MLNAAYLGVKRMKGAFQAINKIISHPVISAVVAAAIIALGTKLLGWWPNIANAAQFVWQFAFSSVSVPVWILAVLILAAIGFVVLFATLVWVNRPQGETWRNYTTDEFYGIKWRWRYFQDGSMSEPLPFCTECDFQLNPSQAGAFAAASHWVYQCEDCGHLCADVQESFVELEDRVKRQVHRKIRSGEWANEQSSA